MRCWVCNSKIQDPVQYSERLMLMRENLCNINIFEVNCSVKHIIVHTHCRDYLFRWWIKVKADGVVGWNTFHLKSTTRVRSSLSSWVCSRHPAGELQFKLLGSHQPQPHCCWAEHWFTTEVLLLGWTNPGQRWRMAPDNPDTTAHFLWEFKSRCHIESKGPRQPDYKGEFEQVLCHNICMFSNSVFIWIFTIYPSIHLWIHTHTFHSDPGAV